MRCDLMRLTSYGIYLVLFVHVALIHILSQSYKSQHESTLGRPGTLLLLAMIFS